MNSIKLNVSNKNFFTLHKVFKISNRHYRFFFLRSIQTCTKSILAIKHKLNVSLKLNDLQLSIAIFLVIIIFLLFVISFRKKDGTSSHEDKDHDDDYKDLPSKKFNFNPLDDEIDLTDNLNPPWNMDTDLFGSMKEETKINDEFRATE